MENSRHASESGAEGYGWLNRTVCLGTGALGRSRVAFQLLVFR